jgi:hypothetical protein
MSDRLGPLPANGPQILMLLTANNFRYQQQMWSKAMESLLFLPFLGRFQRHWPPSIVMPQTDSQMPQSALSL